MAQEALSGVRVVRAYRQEGAELERFRRSNRRILCGGTARLIVLQGFFFPSMSLFLGLGALLGRVARRPRGDSTAGSRSASSWRSTPI